MAKRTGKHTRPHYPTFLQWATVDHPCDPSIIFDKYGPEIWSHVPPADRMRLARVSVSYREFMAAMIAHARQKTGYVNIATLGREVY